MAFVNLKERDIPGPDSRNYSTLKDKDCKCTIHFIVNYRDLNLFTSVSNSFIFNSEVELSDAQQIFGLSDNSCMYFSLRFSSVEHKDNELENFKLALKTAKFYEMKKN
jgi:hypothetical protein